MKRLLLITTLLIATPAMADTIQQNGVGNQADQNSFNTTIDSGNTTNNVNSNDPHVTATGGKANASSHSYSTSKSSSHSSAKQSQSANNDGNAQTLNQNYQRNPVSTAFAAPLTAAEDTCMGSSSAGGQGVGFGLSLGTTWKDEDCVRRKDARELHNMGQKKAALALLCQSAQVAKAMRTAGTPCPGDDGDLAPSAGVVASVTHSGTPVEYTQSPTPSKNW
jgi:hypothetical protein